MLELTFFDIVTARWYKNMRGNESLARRKVIRPSLQHHAFLRVPMRMRVSESAPIFTRIFEEMPDMHHDDILRAE